MSNTTEEKVKKPIFNDTTYTALKFSAQYVLPGAGTLYFTLAQIWGLPYGEQIVGSIAAVNIFLGILLGFGSASYDRSDAKYDGAMNVTVTPGEDPNKHSLEFNQPLEDLEGNKKIVLKVQNINPPRHSAETVDLP